MKIILLLPFFIVSGCMHVIPFLSNEQECASQNMNVQGVELDSNDSIIRGDSKVYTAYSQRKTLRCDQPKSSTDSCKIKVYSESINPLAEYNETVRTKNLTLLLGYAFYAVPGIVMYFIYDGQRRESIGSSLNIQREGLNNCDVKSSANTN